MGTELAVGDRVKVVQGQELRDILSQHVGKVGKIHYVHSQIKDEMDKYIEFEKRDFRKYQVLLRTGENVAFPEDWLEIDE